MGSGHTLLHTMDYGVLAFWHELAEQFSYITTPLAKAITIFGNKGIGMIVIAFIMLWFKQTRKTGLCILVALVIGTLITEFLVKGLVERVRPYKSVDIYQQWWAYINAPKQGGYSFPSGHTTAMTSMMVSLCLDRGKKYISLAVIGILLMGASRTYLMAHYPSDILAGILVGSISGYLGYRIVNRLWAKYFA